MHPRRGEVWWVSFDPSVGGEIQKTRPAVVLNNDSANAALNRVIVTSLSSEYRVRWQESARVYAGEALVTLNGEQPKAMADPIMTASKQRLKNKLGTLSRADVTAIGGAILLQLAIRR
jgi:mRNA interferase MazF